MNISVMLNQIIGQNLINGFGNEIIMNESFETNRIIYELINTLPVTPKIGKPTMTIRKMFKFNMSHKHRPAQVCFAIIVNYIADLAQWYLPAGRQGAAVLLNSQFASVSEQLLRVSPERSEGKTETKLILPT